jgi:pyruvate ferredoxin oxidoreductase delta subunit
MSKKLLSTERLSIGCVAPPGESMQNKTGSWRTQRPVFKKKDCIGCRACELACPEGCVFEDPDHTHVLEKNQREINDRDFDPDYCKGCGICAHECPVDDIDMVMEEK